MKFLAVISCQGCQKVHHSVIWPGIPSHVSKGVDIIYYTWLCTYKVNDITRRSYQHVYYSCHLPDFLLGGYHLMVWLIMDLQGTFWGIFYFLIKDLSKFWVSLFLGYNFFLWMSRGTPGNFQILSLPLTDLHNHCPGLWRSPHQHGKRVLCQGSHRMSLGSSKTHARMF